MQVISVTCECGREYRLSEALAGKRIRCRQCDNVIEVPLPEVVDLEGIADKVRSVPAQSEPPRLRPPPDEDLAPPPPRRKKRRRRREGSGAMPISISPGVILGALMIIGGVVWLVGGLMLGVLFYYGPPLLIIIGAIRFFRSLTGGDDD